MFPTTTTTSTVAAHPLRIFIMRQCAATQLNHTTDGTSRKITPPNDRFASDPAARNVDPRDGDWTLNSGTHNSPSVVTTTLSASSLEMTDALSRSNETRAYLNRRSPFACPYTEGPSDPLTSVSRKIIDLMCDVVPELPSKLPILEGQSGDATLQERITQLIRQQLTPTDANEADKASLQSACGTPLLPSPQSSHVTTHVSSTLPLDSRRYAGSVDLADPCALHARYSNLARLELSPPEDEPLRSQLDWIPMIKYGKMLSEESYSTHTLPIIGKEASSDQERHNTFESPAYSDCIYDAKDESRATRLEDSRKQHLFPSPWWSDSLLPQSDSSVLSEQRGRDHGLCIPLNSEASPCTSTTAGMSDEGLSTIMAEFVLQEFLKSQTGGTGSMSPSDQDCSPKSHQSMSFPPHTPRGSPTFRDYIASPTQSASSGRNERPSSEVTQSGVSRLQKQNRRIAATSSIFAHDVRLGVFARNVDRDSLLTSPSTQSQSSMTLHQRPQLPRTPPDRFSQRRTTLLDGETLLTRAPPNRQMSRQSVELTHSQAMLAMAAAARRNNSAYTDDHDRMVYISWIPKQSRAYTTMDRRRMELELKKKLREEMHLEGVTKVLLFPPKGAHCKLIFDKRASAEKFMQMYGGDDGSKESERWKHDICNAFGIIVNERFAKTVVKIEWSQK